MVFKLEATGHFENKMLISSEEGVPPYHVEIRFGTTLILTFYKVVLTKLYYFFVILYLTAGCK